MDNIKDIFLWFLLYSCIGWIYETILCSVKERRFINRGFLNGPYCPIYGVGAVVNLLALGRFTNPAVLFFAGAIMDCTLEYITSWGMEKLFHARWWDYSKKFLNINGRVCLLGAVAFGAFSVVLVLFMHPFFEDKLSFITPEARDILFWVLLALFVGDNVYTLIGFSPFNKLMGKIVTTSTAGMSTPEELEQNKREARELPDLTELAELPVKLNYQIKRMIRSFPALKSTRYESVVDKLRDHMDEIDKRRKELKRKLKEKK